MNFASFSSLLFQIALRILMLLALKNSGLGLHGLSLSFIPDSSRFLLPFFLLHS